MSTTPALAGTLPLLVVGDTGGITVVDPGTPLKRLNYFDGKFLRADDLRLEQDYLRSLVALSNQGGGPGVVYGYDTTLGSGDTVQVGPGLAIDPAGKVLLLQKAASASIAALIEASRKLVARPPDASGKTGADAAFGDCLEAAAPPPPTTVVQTGDLWVIAICAAEALCGQEDVYGIACQDACATTSDRPYRLDGIVLRAIPLQLVTPFVTSKAVAIDADRYLRSKVANAAFADELLRHPDAISRAGLLSHVWCLGAGYAADCCEVPLAVVARQGATTQFLDAWTVRRERMDAPARRYWQWKMRMRPWDVYLAHILQFQCQLADALAGTALRASASETAAHRALDEAAQFIAQVRSGLAGYRELATGARAAATLDAAGSEKPALLAISLTQVADLQSRLAAVLKTGLTPALPNQRVLISLGFTALPSGGYLPVVTGGAVSVNDQVRALMGEGLDLRFCIVTADYVAHAIEEAQHMDRISLLQGLDDPKAKPHVDILVPDGQATTQGVSGVGLYDATLAFSSKQTGGLAYKGVAREEALASGGTALYSAQAGLSQAAIGKMQTLARAIVRPTATTKPTTVTADLNANAFVRKTGTLGARLDLKVAGAATRARSYVTAGGIAAAGGTVSVGGAKAPTANETVDGLWLEAGVDDRLSGLGVGDHTAVRLRAVIGSRPDTPLAIELSFTGTLTITAASTTAGRLQSSGRLNGVGAIGMLKEDQADQTTMEYQLTERFNWPATLAFEGGAAGGTVTLDLLLAAKNNLRLRIAKTVAAGGVQISYALALVAVGPPQEGGNGGDTVVPLGQLLLGADAAVGDPANLFHQYAESGLALVQAALVVSEPGLQARAEGLLFAAAAAGTPELVITALRDWVAFVRRRERRCAPDAAPPVQLPPRRYRVLEFTQDSLDAVQSAIVQVQQAMKDPAALAALINSALEGDRNKVRLVVTYAGGSAQATSDLVAAEADWKTFAPGKGLHYSAIGAIGETDAALQLSRLATFRTAISADSAEVKGAVEDTLLPYPESAVPPDADGVMILITLRDRVPVAKNDLVTIAVRSSAVTHVVPYFQQQLPRATVAFSDDVPQGSALAGFVAAAPAGVQFSGVVAWSTTAASDAGALARATAVRDAMAQAGRMAASAPVATQVLSSTLLGQATAAGFVLTGIDDVIAVEFDQSAFGVAGPG